jgi:hypothetical protein
MSLSIVVFVGMTSVQAGAGSNLVGTWKCHPINNVAENSVVTMAGDGKITTKNGDGTTTASYTYAGGVLTETAQGLALKAKLVWKGNDAFDLVVSDPDMTSQTCVRSH